MKNIFIVLILLLSTVSLHSQVGPCASGDPDDDGICTSVDNCPDTSNADQADADMDGVGDVCDNSPLPNPDQADIDGDGIGDVSDSCVDPDRDGVCDPLDKCPGSDDRVDEDRDGIPDGCDSCIDRDRDNICDGDDPCVAQLSAGKPCNDNDPCTLYDVYDDNCNCLGEFQDGDGDGTCDAQDECEGSDDSSDYDGDGVPDECDPDPACTVCPPSADGKILFCRIPLNPDNMRNVKGTCEELSKYFNKDGSFANGVDQCGPCQCAYANDVDTDGDGVCDRKDECPNNPDKSKADKCGCDDQDSDGDQVCDSVDLCPGSDDREDEDDDGIPDGCDELNYCTPTVDASMEWIAQIEIADTNLTSEPVDGFVLHHGPILLEQSETYVLTITPEYIDEICELTTLVLIDLNHDGDFEDAGEELAMAKGLDQTTLDLATAHLDVGDYRIRVMLYFGRLRGLCEDIVWGDIEDFIIEVQEPRPCQQVYEGFDYEPDTDLMGESGGTGWSSAWEVIGSTGNVQTILSGTIENEWINGSDNKLGFLNAPGQSSSIKRQMDLSLKGSETLYFSTLVQVASGSGQINFSLGDVSFGINEFGQLFLEDQVRPVVVSTSSHALFVKIEVNQSGQDEVSLWIDLPADQRINDTALRTEIEMGDHLDQLVVQSIANFDFLPFAIYLDDLYMACDDEYQLKSTAKRLKRAAINPSPLSMDIDIHAWPNPSQGWIHIDVTVEADSDLEMSSLLYGIDGAQIWSGVLSSGSNTLTVEALNSGLYYLAVFTANEVLTKEIIISK